MSDTSEQKEILGYAVALLLLKQEAIGHELQLVQSVRPEENEDEAIGISVRRAMRDFPGYKLSSYTSTPIVKPRS